MDAPDPSDAMAAALLERLKDVALPEPTSWFPPAPGWWGLAALVLLICYATFRAIRTWQRRNRYRKEAAAMLTDLREAWQADRDDQAYASSAQQLLRRTAIHIAGRDAFSRLTGMRFIDQINTLSKASISKKTGSYLMESSYRPSVENGFDIDTMHQELEAWLRSLEGVRDA